MEEQQAAELARQQAQQQPNKLNKHNEILNQEGNKVQTYDEEQK